MATPSQTISMTGMMARPMPRFLEEPVSPPAVRLALFGKHPSAADHLEDLGLSSPSLITFKKIFYLEGITECLTRQVWLKDLGAMESVPYDHCLLCLGHTGWLAARFQHSSDAPGRRQFPLVLALHGQDFSALNRIAEVGQILERALAAAIAAKDSAALRQMHAQAQLQCQETLVAPAAAPGASARDSWLQGLPLAPDLQGMWRICHVLSPLGAGVGLARVPLHLGGPWQSATLWLSLIRQLFLPPSGNISLVWRPGQAYGDLVMTAPGGRFLHTLFTPESSLPQSSAVPFNYTPELEKEAREVLQKWLLEPALVPSIQPVNESASLLNKVCNGVRSWFKPSA